ncbi:MAG: hypothetical protein C0476_12480 [Sphingomonas sp.]|nr:hypothetical protein [Sphingomonas sp.]
MIPQRVAIAGYVSVTPRQRATAAALVAVLYALVLVLIAFWPRGVMRPAPAVPPAVAVFVPVPIEPPVAAPSPTRQPPSPSATQQPLPAKPPGPPLATVAPAAAAAPAAPDATPTVSAPPVAVSSPAEGAGRSSAGTAGAADGAGTGAGGGGDGGGGGTLVRAEWARQLNWDDIRLYHPPRAWAKGVSGKVSLTCYVRRNQRAYGCVATSEEPMGEGFGAAAVAMERRFRIKPREVDGKPIDGGRVFFTVNFYTLMR